MVLEEGETVSVTIRIGEGGRLNMKHEQLEYILNWKVGNSFLLSLMLFNCLKKL